MSENQTNKSMTKCQSCNKEIAKSAKTCPNCGAKQKKAIYKKWWFWVILAIIILPILTNMGKEDNGDKTSDSTPKAPEVIEYEKIDAGAFLTEFDENQLAAENKYGNKYVEMSGEIKNISGSDSRPYVSIKPLNYDEWSFSSIQCYVKNKDIIMSLKNGEVRTIQGKVGTQSLGIVEIKDCIIQ